MSRCQTLDARLGLDRFELDEVSHITVDPLRCRICTSRPCLTVCPARVYRQVDDRISVAYENCLECGTCQITCDGLGKGGIGWRNPRGGSGVVFRLG